MATRTDKIQGNGDGNARPSEGTDRVKGPASVARSALGDAYGGAREKVSHAYEGAREGIADAYATAREKASDVGRRAAEGIDDNPVAAIVGGIALGAVVAALVPRSEREAKALAPVGSKLNKAAKGAVEAAKSAGKEKIGELGLASAGESVRKLVGDAVESIGGKTA